jgi:asparagine synthase (glutamine-hydrolysing)
MCGIAGFFSIKEQSLAGNAEAIVDDQIAALHHRGPDAQATYVGPGVALGHARLSIIDTSSAANQPMFDATGKICVVFNGEIYNFQEVRAELEARGVRFRTKSDTEVIVEGYTVWGIDVVHRLRGMFAIALFDANRDRLVLMRDRIGKKPLYYTQHDGCLIFASEIKGILRYPGIARVPDYDAIHEYLTFQYVPSPMTAFCGIHKLPPAHLLVLERGREPVIRKYFQLPTPSQTRARPIETLRGELVEQLKEATRLRMIADVPIGAFLSGGVDSSSVVAMMASLSKDPVKTFTIGFEEQVYDERPFARAVAERYRTDHYEEIVRPDALSIIDDIVYHYGEPYADSSAIPTYYVSKIARRHVTVALNGDGGDESFLGYGRYLRCRGYDDASRLPRPIARNLQRMIKRLPGNRFDIVQRAKRAADVLYQRRSPFYEVSIAYFSEEAKQSLYAGDMRRFLSHSALSRLDHYLDQAKTLTQGAAWADIHTYLPDDLLVKVDVASMAHSLEARSPLLDHKLMEWAATIPEEQRFEGTEPKSLFKQAMEPYLPRDLLYRPKMGFGVPIDLWLRGEMRDFAYDTLTGPTARQRGLFDPKYVHGLLDRHMAGENWAYWIWALLMLELWFRMWIDAKDAFAHVAAPRSMRLEPTAAPRQMADQVSA